MPPLSVMFKTTYACNLACSYCYYRAGGKSGAASNIDLKLLERFIPQYMEYISDTHQASLSWQGGEPTLAGLGFFRRIVELEAEYARPNTTISNAIQTNAVLLDDTWAEFFHKYNFLVGVSLDGPEEVHDSERKDKAGHGSFSRVMAGIEILRKHDVETNILCVVGAHNFSRAKDLMRLFHKEGMGYLQFIPAMAFQSTEPDKEATYLVSPEQYGKFLIELFDEWYKEGIPPISIRVFDNFLQTMVGVDNDLCVHGNACNSGIIVEANGNTYPCDFYIHPRWRLGNISTDTLKAMFGDDRMKNFINQKYPLPFSCQACEWKYLCKGECPRNRKFGPGVEHGESYFCQSYRMLFKHAVERMEKLAMRIQNYRRFLQVQSDKGMRSIGRNDACPCGSGAKFKNCCGDPALTTSYLFLLQS